MLQSVNVPWPLWQRTGFRFTFLFFGLTVFLVNNGAFSFWYLLQPLYNPYLQNFIVWVGDAILKLPYPITVFTNGSGDTTYDWVLLFTITMLAVAGTLIWSLIDRRKQGGYPVLYYWLMVLLRYYVGLMLISYGLVKVIQLQFPAPGLYRLLQPYGNSSPMGLAWTFLGFSKGYNMFMGIAEMAAGLLLFRRTVTAGAIVSLMTTANVMAVNYFFDVPVKIVSTLLVVMTLMILIPDIRRLWLFFFSGKPVHLPKMKAPYFSKKWQRVGLTVAKVLIIISGPGLGLVQIVSYLQEQRNGNPGYFGLYQIETFVRNGDTLPPLRTDSTRWYRMAIENPYNLRVVMTNDSARRYSYQADTTNSILTLSPIGDTITLMKLHYAEPTPGSFILSQYGAGDSVLMTGSIVRDFKKEFLLTNRGFHWISETPFNR
jgi:hypothetical protein